MSERVCLPANPRNCPVCKSSWFENEKKNANVLVAVIPSGKYILCNVCLEIWNWDKSPADKIAYLKEVNQLT